MFRRKPNRDDIDRLIARKRYPKAIHWLRRMIEDEPKDFRLRRQLAELLLLVDERQEALWMLQELARELSEGGFVAKAIVVLKRIQTLTLDVSGTEERIARLIDSQSGGQGEEDGDRLPTGGEGASWPPPDDEDDEDTVSMVPMAFAQSPLFRRFTRTEMMAVVDSLEALSVEAGEIVVSEGQAGECLYLIVSGSVRVYVLNQLRENVQVRVLSPGDFFGEISLHTGKARTATITSIEPTELLALDREALHHLGRSHPEIPLIIHDFCQRRERSPEELEARGWPQEEPVAPG